MTQLFSWKNIKRIEIIMISEVLIISYYQESKSKNQLLTFININAIIWLGGKFKLLKY